MEENVPLSILSFKRPLGNVLIIYTGGTFGMVKKQSNDTLVPYNLSNLLDYFPDLHQLNINVALFEIAHIIDSSNLSPKVWLELVAVIERFYSLYDGFIIIHGTDTMAYSASAISFMIENLGKPIVFTGAQLPVSMIRSDARDNLISALEIAALKSNGRPIVNEVTIYFNNILLRGNRAKKVESSHFDAFESPNYPILAETGINIDFQYDDLLVQPKGEVQFHKHIADQVAVVKLFPGITEAYLKPIFENRTIRGIVLESFGSGNAPSFPWFLQLIENAIDRGVVIYNTSQCIKGMVSPNRYETGKVMYKLGVIPGKDITVEAAITKLMFLLGNYDDLNIIVSKLGNDICGEMSE